MFLLPKLQKQLIPIIQYIHFSFRFLLRLLPSVKSQVLQQVVALLVVFQIDETEFVPRLDGDAVHQAQHLLQQAVPVRLTRGGLEHVPDPPPLGPHHPGEAVERLVVMADQVHEQTEMVGEEPGARVDQDGGLAHLVRDSGGGFEFLQAGFPCLTAGGATPGRTAWVLHSDLY